MNRFSIWTYAFILLVLSIGLIYSLPNLYPAKPAIQVAYTDSGKSADQQLLTQVKNILKNQAIESESVGLKANNIVAKFNSLDDQLAGKAALQKALLDRAIVALNLEPSTPQWLSDIGGPTFIFIRMASRVSDSLSLFTSQISQDSYSVWKSGMAESLARRGIF